jgi:hypothetical protein
MPSHSFRLSIDVLVKDRDRPNALATPGTVEVDIEAKDIGEACQKLGESISRMARASRPERYSNPELYVVDATG